MISIELADDLPNVKQLHSLTKNEYPCLFLGFVIRNEYDNQRLQIDKKYSPIKFFHKDIIFYGIKLTANANIQNITNIIKQQELHNNSTLPVYENILNQFSMSCKNTHRWFMKGIYPIDFDNLKKVCTDNFNEDKKIFQHMLCIDEKVFDFQKFASLKLFIFTTQ